MSATISDTFRLALLKRRAAGERVYQIAARAHVRPNTLSGIVGGSIAVRRNDNRVLRVAAVLGIRPEDCFIDVEPEVVV